MYLKVGLVGLGLIGILGSCTVFAEGDSFMEMKHAIEVLQRESHTKRQADDEQITELKRRIQLLEKDKLQTTDKHLHGSAAEEPGQINMRLSGMAAMGGSTVDDAALQNLQSGSHDPNRNGFTVQLLGLVFEGSLNPYMDARSSIVNRIDILGESKTELEEAYVLTRDFGHRLQIKAGQYFTEVGYLNAVHAHDWDFVDKPVVLSRLFGGDSLRNPGVRLAWDTQASWATKLLVGVQHPKGETAVSFLSKPDEDIAGHLIIDREVNGLSDLLYSFKWTRDWETNRGTSIKSGVSALWGPNASGLETRTVIYGFDVSAHWRSDKGPSAVPVASWNTEFLYRDYEAGDTTDLSHEILRDWGIYTQMLWWFQPHWRSGLRLEYATGNKNNATDPIRDNRTRVSVNLTWNPWENTALRFQYNRDHAEHLPGRSADTVWLQLVYALGGHGEDDH